MPEIKKGIYRHFKGNEYLFLGTCRHSETGETMVLYRSLKDKNSLWVRPIAMWNETVKRDGKTFLRFEWVREA